MKGKVAVTNGLGSGVDIIMRTALRRHGLEVQRDYTMIEAPFPTHKEMLKEHKGDLVVGVLPFSYDRELNEFAKPLFTTQSSLGRIALSFWVVRQSFIQKNRAALIDLLEDYGTMLRWFYDGANHDEAVGITARFSNGRRLPCRTGCSRPGTSTAISTASLISTSSRRASTRSRRWDLSRRRSRLRNTPI